MIISTPYILASRFFNSVETILGLEWQERGVGAEDTILIENNDNLLAQKSPYSLADVFYSLKIQTAKEFEQFENLVFATADN